jgi:cysteine-rich repeat protein
MHVKPRWIPFCAVALVAFLASCEGGKATLPGPDTEPCELGGTFLVGRPSVVDGSCDAHFPTERVFEVVPTADPTMLLAQYAGFVLDGKTEVPCRLRAPVETVPHGDTTATMAALLTVEGDRLDVTVDYHIDGLTAGELCDVRYMLVGTRIDTLPGGNLTGGACGTGATCTNELCAFGGVSACAFSTCVYQRTEVAEWVYCTEPCELGSCPEGYTCQNFGPWVYHSDEEWFCVATEPVCGDSQRDGWEACDDGNRIDADGCSADCLSDESCGNDTLDLSVGEVCDDGNVVDGDGCSAFCTIEACGNSAVDYGETCDDGNQVAGDGCGPECFWEACGNGRLDPGEGCDDGNLQDTDTCDGLCRVRLPLGHGRVDATWAHELGGGAFAGIEGHHVVTLADRAVSLWSERYQAPGPFGATLETYVSIVGEADPFVTPPRRIPAFAAWQLEGATVRGASELVVLLRSGADLALSRSLDGGGSFSAPATVTVPGVPLATDSGAFARLAGDGVHLYLLVGLELVVVGRNRNLFFSRSEDGGITWSSAVRLSPAADFLGWASLPTVWAGPSGALAVVWGDGAEGAGDLLAARSRDGGTTWLRLAEVLGAHPQGRGERTEIGVTAGLDDVRVSWTGPGGAWLARWDGSSSPWDLTRIAAATALASPVGPTSVAIGVTGRVGFAFTAANRVLVAMSPGPTSAFAAPEIVGRLPAAAIATQTGPLLFATENEGGAAGTEAWVLSWVANLRVGSNEGWSILAVRSTDAGLSWSAGVTPLVGQRVRGPGDREVWRFARVGDRELAWVSLGEELVLLDLAGLSLASPPPPPPNTAGSGCAEALANGGWCLPSLIGGPSARAGATAVMAGASMIVYGGSDGFRPLGDGGIYDVSADSWRALDARRSSAALWPRVDHSAVWTGSEMIVFGGHNGLVPLGDGGRFDPATDTWTPLPSANAPESRTGHTAVWTGSEMIVFGGAGKTGVLGTGARYRRGDDAWVAIAERADAAREAHAAVWTGSEMIVFGGRDAAGRAMAHGVRYDPVRDAWLPLPQLQAPAARADHTALWTGTEMLVWGGSDGIGPVSGGGRYDLANDSWAQLPNPGAPTARAGHVAAEQTVMSGGVTSTVAWLIWGGLPTSAGAIYATGTPGWTAMSNLGAPTPRGDAVAVWAGYPLNRMVVFGGRDAEGGVLADGGVFVPDDPN